MKTKMNYWKLLILVCIIGGFITSCGKDDPQLNNPEEPTVIDDPSTPSTPTPDPEGTITANISENTSIEVTNIGTIRWTEPDNFYIKGYFYDSWNTYLVSICNLGAMQGLGNVVSIPQTNFTVPQSTNNVVACESGHGYVIKFEGGNLTTPVYVRLYVVDDIGAGAAKVKYQYPFEPTNLTVSKDSLSFTKDQSTQTITVTTDATNWTYSCNSPWISLVKDNNTLSVSVTENIEYERSDAITILANEKSKVITVKQAMSTLTTSKDSLSFTAAQGTQTITVTTDASDWTYSFNASTWMNITRNGNTLSVSVSENTGFERSGTITIQANVQQKNITVKQAMSTTSAPYAIGDIYNEKGVMGVVYNITDEGMHGMIVSMEETACVWSTVYENTGCSDLSNGMNNMNTIKKIAGWENKYPAFKWCNDFNMGSVSGWYLPAKDELNDLYASYQQVNTTLMNGGLMQIMADYYWSSSEYDSSNAWYQYFYYNYWGNQNSTSKNNTFKVRAVRAF